MPSLASFAANGVHFILEITKNIRNLRASEREVLKSNERSGVKRLSF
mgnify:CR=1 FL=1